MPLHIVSHPVAQDALCVLRDRATPPIEYRRATRRLSLILAVEATRALATTPTRVETPLETADGVALKSRVVVVPILRAGLGMVDAVLDVVPTARVGHLGLARDEQTAVAGRYYGHLPEGLAGDVVLIVDPMLATGGSAKLAIDEVKRAGARDVRLVCIIAAPEGVAAVQSAHPSLDIYAAVVDRELNAKKFILPGLGDFGDRLYGTT